MTSQRLPRRYSYVRVVLITASILFAVPIHAATLPTGFSETLVASGLSNATAMQFAPDGRLFVCQQDGRLRVIKNGSLLPTPFVTVNVDSNGERGLLGVAFDPHFSTNHFVYIYYTALTPAVHNRISRLTANGDVALAGSEVVIFDLDNLSSATNHNGGALAFGPFDEKLYAAVGENGNSANAQSMNTVLGKMLRLNVDGTIPADNPFLSSTSGKNRAIWALGLRNPFTFAFNAASGALFINDVGETSWEEIDDGIAGANYGWPTSEGATTNPNFTSPRYTYSHADGCAITGGSFYIPLTNQFPSSYVNDYFFADYCGGWIKKLDPSGNSVTTFATGIAAPVDLKVADDGSLYYLARDAGSVFRVQYGAAGPTITSHPASQTVAPGASATFSVRASGPPPLRYQWLRDGVNIPGATAPDYTIAAVTASDNGARFRANVSNDSDPNGILSNEATLTVSSNRPPTGTITSPVAGTIYGGGTVISYGGTATDPEDGTLPGSAFTWQVDFHHDTHIHPFIPATTGSSSGTFTIPSIGETSANVWYRIILTVRDSGGLTHTSQRDILPNKVVLTLGANPSGLQVTLDGQPVATPLSFDAVVGIVRTIGVTSPQVSGGTTYTFVSWSDAGSASHSISTPAVNTTYTATYQSSGSAPPPIALVQHVSKDAGTTTSASLAFPSANTAGNWLGVVVRAGQSGQTFTVTDTRGNTYRKAAQLSETVDGNTLAIYYAENIAGGTNTITVSDSLSGGTLRFAALEYAGVAAANSLDASSTGAGSSATPATGTVTTTSNGDLVLGILSTANSRTLTAGSGFVVRESVPAAPNSKLFVEDRLQSTAGGVSAGGSLNSSDTWGAIVAAFRASATGPSVPPDPAPGGDTQPPTAPGSLTATPTSSSAIDLNWIASTDNAGVAQYHVEQCVGAGCTNYAEIGTVNGASGAGGGPLSASANPNYFKDASGTPIILNGSHTWNSLQDWGTNGSLQPLDFSAFVNFLVAHGHNFTFLWATELTTFCNLPTSATSPPNFTVGPHPWQRTGPGNATDGKPRFDLTKFDQAYFDRVRARVQALNDAGIYAGIYLFSGEWLSQFRCVADGYPLTGTNNISGVDAGTGSGGVTMSSPNAVTGVQDRYVEKLVDTLNDLPNVLWIVAEEAPAESVWWSGHHRSHLRSYESGKPYQHPIGYAVDSSWQDSVLTNSDADWISPIARISPTTSCGSGTPPCKVNINDSDHSYFGIWNDDPQTQRNYAWENFMNGNQVAFMDPYLVYYPRENRNLCASPVNGICSGLDARWENFRNNLGYILRYSRRINLANVRPQGSLCSTSNCLAQTPSAGAEYLVYAPNGGSFTVNLSAMSSARQLTVEWFNPATGATIAGGSVAAGSAARSFTPPFSGDAVLYLVDAAGHAGTSSSPAATSYHVTGVSPGSSSYRVRAEDAAGNLGPYSNVASATLGDTQPPTVPAGLTATAMSSSQINLQWTASTDNMSVAGYRVQRCEGPGCTNFVQVGTATSTSFADTGLAASTSCSYQVVAMDQANNASGPSNRASATTMPAPGPGAIALRQHAGKDAGATTSSSLAFPSANTAGNWIGVVIRAGQPGQAFTISDTRGNSYQRAVQVSETSDGTTLAIFYAENIAAGANTVTVSDTLSGGTLRFAILEYAGVATSNSFDAGASGSGSSASPASGTATTTANGDLVIGVLSTANPRTFTAGSGFTIQERVPGAPNSKLSVEDRIQSAAGPVAGSGSIDSSDIWSAAVAAFRAR